MNERPWQFVRRLIRCREILLVVLFAVAILPGGAFAAPYAAMVIDARTGEVLHSRNADTRLHPASLTKMMTLYIAFEAVSRGEISLDRKIKISRHAASEPPSKLGLKAGQSIALRYLIRAAAVKSANDAATALGEAISGSEAAFARRMNRTAKALGMTNTTFRNAHGLTEAGHLSSARDMTTLGRRLFYDYPQYYNLFSRRSADAGVRTVSNTNRRLLAAYKGADGIKTGYTNAAGFNLVASAERGQKRVIATVFGGRSSASRNARVAELLDMGFSRAPGRAMVQMPSKPTYAVASLADVGADPAPAVAAPAAPMGLAVSVRPRGRPGTVPGAEDPVIAAIAEATAAVGDTEIAVMTGGAAAASAASGIVLLAEGSPDMPGAVLGNAPAAVASLIAPAAVRPPLLRPAVSALGAAPPVPEVVTRISTSGGRHWGINIGRYTSRHEAERMLLKTALVEIGTLDEALRKVVGQSGGYDANFVGMTEGMADLACRRLSARDQECSPFGPG